MGASTLEPDYAMPRSGKLKNVDKGVVIEFYVKYTVYITRSSGLICFTEEEFTSFFVKKGSGH